MSTAETRDELRNALENHARQLALVMDSPSGSANTGTWATLAMARAVTTSAMVNLEHLEHSIAAAADHREQGDHLLAMMRESSVAPADFGRAMIALAQVVSYLEDPMGHPSRFELDREDRDAESAARLLGFLEPDPVAPTSADDEGPAYPNPEWNRTPAPRAVLEDGTPVDAAIADAEGGPVPGVDFAVRPPAEA